MAKKTVKSVFKNGDEVVKYSDEVADGIESTIKNSDDITKGGKAKNKLKPDPSATGAHTTYKVDPNTGKVTNYKTWEPNPQNPYGFDMVKGYDGIGKPHYNKLTKEYLMPHIHDPKVPGKLRKPLPWEIPPLLLKKKGKYMSILNWLMDWYESNCDGDWEHLFGISIKTLDNLGWGVEIDLSDTLLEDKRFDELKINKGNYNWITCSVENNIFKGYGDPDKLEEILKSFRKWAENQY